MVCLKNVFRRSLVCKFPKAETQKDNNSEEICRKASAVHVSLSYYSIVKEQIQRPETPYRPIKGLAPANRFRHEPNQCLIRLEWKAF